MSTRASDKQPTPTPTVPPKPGPLAAPNEVVRVRHPRTGAHYSTTRAAAARVGAEVLEGRPAVDRHGQRLPIKPQTPIAPKES